MKTRLLLLILFATTLRAHEGLHEQLEAATKRIAAEPRKASLRLERAELYRLHHAWPLARADYDAAAKLDPSLPAIAFARGRMELEAGRPSVALPLLDRFLASNPAHGEAHLTRARILVKLGRLDAAIAEYDAAIANTAPPNPDLYWERAQTLGPDHIDAALRGLDEAMARLGDLVSLQQQAIDLAVAARRYDDALARLDRLAKNAARPQMFAAQRANIISARNAAAASPAPAPPSKPSAQP